MRGQWRILSVAAIIALVASSTVLRAEGSLGAPTDGTTAPRVEGSSDCSDPKLTPPERQLCIDNKIFNDTILGGAATWAMAGAGSALVLCLITGGKLGTCAIAGAIGAAAGGAAGAIDGYVTAKQQEESRGSIRAIDAATRDVKNDNQRLSQAIQNAELVVKDSTSRLQQIDEQVKSRQMTLEQAQAERERIERNKQNLDQLIASLEERRSEYQEAALKMSQPSQDFDDRLREMNSDIDQLKQQRDALDQALAVRNIG
ncbi:MAG: hypothetical protein ACLQME_24280 [Alphaproteobacteria bacterium]